MPWLVRLTWAALLLLLAAPARTDEPAWEHIVRPGDTIWDLAQEHLRSPSEWQRLQDHNRVSEPRRLEPGTRLAFPLSWLRRNPVPARVQALRGTAFVRRARATSDAPLTVGAELHRDDMVVTGEDGFVELRFADGSTLAMAPGSRVVLDQLSAYGGTGMVDTRLRLEDGRGSSVVAPARGPGTRFEIHTVPAVSSVRGTHFRVGVAERGDRAVTEVVSGAVGVAGAGRTRRVGSGFGTVTMRGRPPAPPRPLLPPPPVEQLPVLLDRVPVAFTAPEQPGAVGWRLAILDPASPGAVLTERVFDGPALRGPDLPDGDYHFRLRAIDARGIEGLDREWRARVDARPEPPVPLAPQREGRVREAQPAFTWAVVEGALSYHVQVADTPDFRAPIVDLPEVRGGAVSAPQPLPTGTWYWRVATRDATGRGPFSDPEPFERRDPPASPELEPPSLDEDMLRLRVRDAGPGVRYQFQLSRDRGFQEIVVDATTTEPELRIRRPLPDRYYLRVRTLDDDGYEGPFGPAQQLEVPPTSWWPFLIPPLFLLLVLL